MSAAVITWILIGLGILLFIFRRKTFRYVEPLWQGNDGKVSTRSTLALAFSVNLMQNLTHAIYKWDAGRPLEGLALVLGIEAGLIASLLALSTYQNVASKIADNPIQKINVENVEQVNPPPDSTTIIKIPENTKPTKE